MRAAIRKKKLRDAWWGPFTAEQVARHHHQPSPKAVQMFWAREKAAGRLPDGPRPFFVAETFATVPPAAMPGQFCIDVRLDAEIERSEAALDQSGLAVPPGDPLLAALYAAHDGDPCRAVEARAGEIIAGIDGDKVFPSAAGVALHARALDNAMRRINPELA